MSALPIESEPRHNERRPLPTKAQINAISDVDALEAMSDEVDRRIARIETDLDFKDADDEWERRAIAALSIHRYTANLMARRIAALSRKTPFQAVAQVETARRVRKECSPLTQALLDGPVCADDDSTIEGVEQALAQVNEAITAAEMDRADEISRFSPGARDEVWLVAVNAAIKSARSVRHALTLKKAALLKAEKVEEQQRMDRARERMFIDECRAVLPRETYLMLWDRVDRLQLANAGEGG